MTLDARMPIPGTLGRLTTLSLLAWLCTETANRNLTLNLGRGKLYEPWAVQHRPEVVRATDSRQTLDSVANNRSLGILT